MAVTSEINIVVDAVPTLATIPVTPFASGTATPIVTASGRASPTPTPSVPRPDPATVYPIGLPPAAAMARLSDESRGCLERLAAHTAAPPQDTGLARTAAVLIALYQRPGESGLRVLLTTRARHLRRNPGQTALPGGKADPEDPSVVYTARREAHEEVGLPPVHPDVYTVAVLDPLLTVLPLGAHTRNHIVVTSVVAFVADPSVIDQLKPSPDEVDFIFDYPLAAIYTGTLQDPDVGALTPLGGEWWPWAEEQFHTQEDRVGYTGPYRMHRFRTTHSPLRGFTADVLVSAVSIAYGAEPAYGHRARGQLLPPAMIARVVAELPDALKEPVSTEKRPIEWGRLDGTTIKSGETYYSQ